ncbi:MAG: preprotein translocase subunit SecE [Verrucomicrobia bacterium]|nr:preprotein translocase subunit SecE [Kiritimatiellia bacterium]MCP5487337.1 preprotein translocase subunit SecE [Verrucomicrobiota bacterium]
MSKATSVFSGTRTFLDEVKAELYKCAWPTQKELVQSTIVVIVSVILLAIIVGVSDLVWMTALQWIIG